MTGALFDRLQAAVGTRLETPPQRISVAEADVFDRLSRVVLDFERRPGGPVRDAPVSPLHLVALVPRFAAQLGGPVTTDGASTAMNYGFDNLSFPAPLACEEPFIAALTTRRVTERSPGAYLIATDLEVRPVAADEPCLLGRNFGLILSLDQHLRA